MVAVMVAGSASRQDARAVSRLGKGQGKEPQREWHTVNDSARCMGGEVKHAPASGELKTSA